MSYVDDVFRYFPVRFTSVKVTAISRFTVRFAKREIAAQLGILLRKTLAEQQREQYLFHLCP